MATVNPVQTNTYHLTPGNNPITFCPATNIDVTNGDDAVVGNYFVGVNLTNDGNITATGTASRGIELYDGGSVVNNTSGNIWANKYGIDILGGVGSVTNYGSIYSQTHSAVGLTDGGTAVNRSGGLISAPGGVGIFIYGGLGSVTNAGAISDVGQGVQLKDGGTVQDEKGGIIAAAVVGVNLGASLPGNPSGAGGELIVSAGGSISAGTGVVSGGAPASAINAGTITGTGTTVISDDGISLNLGNGIALTAGGTVDNQTGGTITGARYGVAITGGSGTVDNQTGGTITGARYGVYITGGSGTVTNAGAISGTTDSVVFAGYGDNTLTLQTGSQLTGNAIGSTFLGATNALVLQGTGTANNNFDNFDTLAVQSGASWTLGGTSSIGATLVDDAVLAVTGSLTSEFTIENGGVLDFTGAFDGRARFIGAGTLQVGGDAAGTVTGFGQGDVIDFENVAYASGDKVSVVASAADDTIEILNASNQDIASFAAGVGYTTSDFTLQSINGGAGLSVTGGETVVTVSEFFADRTTLDANPNGFLVEDTALNVASGLTALNADAHVNGITLTDFPYPVLTLSPSQIESDRAALGKVSEPYGIAVVDATANDSLDMQTLAAPSQVVSVTLSDGGKVVNEAGLSIEAPGAGAGAADGVYMNGGGSVTNAGTISSSSLGVLLDAGGTVTNKAGGTISGNVIGVYIVGGAGTVTNAGAITGGVGLLDGGTVTNERQGIITGEVGFDFGVFTITTNAGAVINYGTITGSVGFGGGAGTVTNDGAIRGGVYSGSGLGTVINEAGGTINCVWISSGGALTNAGAITSGEWRIGGVYLRDGGTVTNEIGGEISGGVTAGGASATVTNAGTVTATGTYSDDVELLDGGTVTNQTGGTITGATDGVYVTGGAGTVTNAGTISGTTDSVVFAGSGANTLTLQTGSLLTGDVVGSTASGATNALVLEGTGSADNHFDNFNTLNVEASGDWTLGGADAIGATTVSSGTLIVTGDLTGSATIASGSTLEISGADSTGSMAFASGATGATLKIDGAGMPTGVISDFATGDTIDLRNIAYDSSGSATLQQGGQLEIVEGGQTYDLLLDPDQVFPATFKLSSDGASGTDITLEPAPLFDLGDFNGDGLSDILWRNTDGDTAIWISNGSVGFSNYYDLGVVPTSWEIAGVGDFTGDGKSDILWSNTANGEIGLWESNGSGSFTDLMLGDVPTSWQIAGVGDFTGDGLSDILWRNTDGDTALWISNGSGGFSNYDDLGVVPTSWQIAGVGDFTGDGKSDILWRNTDGDTALWISNGSGGFSNYEDLGVVSTSWQIAGVGDFNGNGMSDILWRNTDGDTALWISNGSGGFSNYYDLGVVSTSWQITGVGDLNGDGKSDILWSNANGDTGLWESTGSGGFSYHDLGVVPSSWKILGG